MHPGTRMASFFVSANSNIGVIEDAGMGAGRGRGDGGKSGGGGLHEVANRQRQELSAASLTATRLMMKAVTGSDSVA